MKKSTWLYELVNERYNGMSKDELRTIITELIYSCSENMNDRQEDKAFNEVIDTLKEYEII